MVKRGFPRRWVGQRCAVWDIRRLWPDGAIMKFKTIRDMYYVWSLSLFCTSLLTGSGYNCVCQIAEDSLSQHYRLRRSVVHPLQVEIVGITEVRAIHDDVLCDCSKKECSIFLEIGVLWTLNIVSFGVGLHLRSFVSGCWTNNVGLTCSLDRMNCVNGWSAAVLAVPVSYGHSTGLYSNPALALHRTAKSWLAKSVSRSVGASFTAGVNVNVSALE